MNPLLEIHHLVLLILIAIAWGGYTSWQSTDRFPLRQRFRILAFRIMALVFLSIVALNPGHWSNKREEEKRCWTVLVDRSASMSHKDVTSGSRFQEACRIEGTIREGSSDEDIVQTYTFTDKLEPLNTSLTNLMATGDSTDIFSAVNQALSVRGINQTPAGIFILSDGRNLGEGNPTVLGMRARSNQIPVYPIVLGGPVLNPELKISTSLRHIVCYKEQPIHMRAKITRQAMEPMVIQGWVKDLHNEKINRFTADLSSSEETTVPIVLEGQKPGYYEYTLEVPLSPHEKDSANNSVQIGVTVLGSPLRVLLVEGTPSWDTKFLTQLLRNSENMEVTSIYRLAQDRYFKVASDENETRDAVTAIFPDTKEALSQYDIVIFGRGVEYFLTPERVDLVKYFVREVGGCVLFSRGKPYKGEFSLLDSLEPIRWGKGLQSEFKMIPTAKGETVGLFGDLLAGSDSLIWDELPSLSNATESISLKSFSSVLALGKYEHKGRGKTIPMVVSRRYGKGVSIVVNLEGMWKWDFFPAMKEAGKVYTSFWIQIVTWAATHSDFLSGQNYNLRLSELTSFPEKPLRIRVCRRSGSLGPVPELLIRKETEVIKKLSLKNSSSGENQWDLVTSLSEPGTYCLELTEMDKALGPRAIVFIAPRPKETDNMASTADFLKELALASGGGIINEDKIQGILTLKTKYAAKADEGAQWESSWDNPILLALILTVLSAEWFFRRRGGLL